jgi:predicted phage terminase large subunit-like protein
MDTPGGVFWWVAPNYPEINNSRIWVNLKKACRDAGEISEQRKEIVLANGAMLAVRSADEPDTLRGPGLDGVFIDEAAMVEEEAWAEVLRPALADKQGWAMFGTTPKGKNWLHKLWLRGQAQERGWESWQRPTEDNPLITASELEDLERELGPRSYAQEICARFTDIQGALWPGHYFEDHIWSADWPDAFEISAVAIDPSLGKQSKPGDYSAIVFAGLARGRIWIDASLRRRPPLNIVEDTIALWRTYQPMTVGVESNGFQEVLGVLFDQYCEINNLPPLPLVMMNNKGKKEHRIQRLDPYLANKQLRFLRSEDNRLLVDQLQLFPEADHDDGPDGLEMVVRLLNHLAGQGVEAHEEFAIA